MYNFKFKKSAVPMYKEEAGSKIYILHESIHLLL